MATLKELETMIYPEYINQTNAYKIVQNWENIMLDFPEMRKQKIQSSIDEGIDPLCALKKIVKQKKDVLHTKYNFSKRLKTYGRLFAQNPSLSNLPREVRNSIGNETYYDVDIKNCHPQILYQYCKKQDIPCESLTTFVENRDAIITALCEHNFGMDRDIAKNTLLSVINGGGAVDFQEDKFISKFTEEMKNIRDAVCRHNIEEYEKMKKRKVDNIKGKTMNVILCKVEHKILMNAVKYMLDQGYSVDVLVFDGFMVRKNKPLTPEVLVNLQEHIKNKLSYNMEFVEKSMSDTIDLSKYPDPVDITNRETTYHRDKEEFEKTHVKIIYPPMFITTFDDNNVTFQTESNCITSHKHLKTTILTEKEKVVKTSFIMTWMNDVNIRCYRKMVFVPSPAEYDPEDYNSWRDFEQERVELPSNFDMQTNIHIQVFREFISNLFGDVLESVNFFIAWCANIIQNPSKRSCICLVLYSMEEGAGKNMIIKTIEKCIGKSYVNYISDVGNQLFGKHAAAEMNKLLVVLNEVKGKDTYSNTDLFKTRITDDVREVELKGKEMMQINNFASYVINTNNVNMVNCGDNDRRFCVLDCNNKKLADKQYFKNYENQINQSPEAIRCIYEYLKNFDIEKVVPGLIFSDHRPKGELYQELVNCNQLKEWAFLEHYVRNTKAGISKDTISNDKFWNDFKGFCFNNNHNIENVSSKKFHFLFNSLIQKPLNAKTPNIIETTRSGSSRARVFNFEKLREYFQIDKKDINLFQNDSDDES
jgi:hypothetical protein